MDDYHCNIMSELQHVVCTACYKGILTVISEVGIEERDVRRSFNHSQQLTEGFTNVMCVASHL